MKRLLKWIMIILSIVSVLCIASIAIIPKLYSEKIKLAIEQSVNKQIEAHVKFNAIGVKLFQHFPNLTCSLTDLSIVGMDDFQSDTLAQIKEMQLEVNLWKYLSTGEIAINSVHLFDPEINVYVLLDGQVNYNIVKATGDSTAKDSPVKLNIDVKNVSIHQGRVAYVDFRQNMKINAFGVEHLGQGNFSENIFDYSTKTTINEFSANYNNIQYLNKEFVDLDLALEMNVPENKYTFKKNKIKIDHFTFSLDGFFQQLPDRYFMDIKTQTTETDFKNILSLLPGFYLKTFDHLKTKGDLSFAGQINGIYSVNQLPSYHFDLNVKDAMVKVDSLPEAFNNIQFDMLIDNNSETPDSTILNIKTFHVDLGKDPIHGSIKVVGIDKLKIVADILANLELSSLEKLFPMKSLMVKGKANLELKVNGVYEQAKSKIPVFALALKLTDGYVRYDSLPRPVSNIQFHLQAENKTGHLANTMLDFRQIHAEVDDNTLHGFAKLSGYPDIEIDADLDADLDLEDIEKIYPIEDYLIKGKFNLDFLAKGLYSKEKKTFPLVDTRMTLNDGSIQFKGYPHPMTDIHFSAEAISKTGDFKDARLDISKFTYTLEDEPFTITGSLVDLNNYKYSFNVKGKADLSKISKVYPLEGIELAGLIDAEMKTSGLIGDLENGNYGNITSNGNVIFKGIKISGSKVASPVAIEYAQLNFTQSKIILENLRGKFGHSNVTLRGDISNYLAFATKNDDVIKADLVLACDTLDLNEWLPPVQTASGKPLPKSDSSVTQLAVIEIPKNIDFTFDSEIRVLKYEDLVITEMDGEITMKDGIMSLHETGFNSLNAKFNVTGDYNTVDLAHPVFDLDLDIKDLDINRAYREISLVKQLAPSIENVYGKFSVNYKIKGELAKDMQPKLETLVGGGVMRIAEAKINGMKLFEEISKSAKKSEINDPHLKDFTMETEIRDNKIIVKPFSIKVSGFDADIEGENTMDGIVRYLVKIELVPLTKIKIPFHVTGNYDNPKVTLGKGHILPE